MRQLQFLVKPASGFCNMRCQYCFYQDELQNRICPDSSMMSEDTAEMMIRQSIPDRVYDILTNIPKRTAQGISQTCQNIA